jgi:7-alpha-hydroxysteroid dehydrogenase
VSVLDRFRLVGRTALVTGASKGIGYGVAEALASAGADVVLVARDADRLAAARAKLEADVSARVCDVAADVTTVSGVQAAVERAVATYGRIDVLVNNVGGARAPGFATASLRRLTPEDFDHCFQYNLRSPLLMAQAAVEVMRDRGAGSIVNIGSAVGRPYLSPMKGSSLYAAAKAGLEQLTRYMAIEWAPAIRVNCVASGLVASPASTERVQGELRARVLASMAIDRVGTPEDIAAAVLLLASDAGSWITGATLDVNGGMGLTSLV